MSSLFGLNKLMNKKNDEMKSDNNNINININEEKMEVNKLPYIKLEIENHIKDLEKTFKINQDYIYNIILLLHINQKNKKKLIDTLERIKLLFNKKNQYRKELIDISSKILINKQINEEIKRRYKEDVICQIDEISNYEESLNRKKLLIKRLRQKYNQLEVFIRKKSKLPENIEKYGKWNTFTVNTFLKKNEYLSKNKKFYQINNKNKENALIKLKSETTFLKQSKNVKIIFKQNNPYNNNKINEINNYYINIFSLKEKEIELLKCLNLLIIRHKYNLKNNIINETIFENKINKEEIVNKNNKRNKNDINIENDFLFVINEIDKDFKEFSNIYNYWIDSEPE